MNRLYEMVFDSDTYDSICNLLTDFESDSGCKIENDYWKSRLYKMLVDIQNMMAEAIN